MAPIGSKAPPSATNGYPLTSAIPRLRPRSLGAAIRCEGREPGSCIAARLCRTITSPASCKKSSGMVRPSAFAVLRLRLTTSSNLYYSAAVLAGLPAAAFQDAVDIRRRLPVRSGSRKMQRFIRAKLEGPSLIISWANRDRTNQPFLPSNVGFAPKAIRRVPHWRGGLRVAHYTARRIRSRLHPRAALPSSRIR